MALYQEGREHRSFFYWLTPPGRMPLQPELAHPQTGLWSLFFHYALQDGVPSLYQK